MDADRPEAPNKNQREALHKHIREVKERYKLPSPPAVVSKVISIMKNPDFNVRDLSRVISDDPALASRALSLSRSLKYAKRLQPRTVHDAILVLGFQTVRNIVIASAAQSFMTRKNRISERLWAHSLAAAMASRLLAKRIGFADPEVAFLAGLLHDVGEMILFNGDPRGFEEIVAQAEEARQPLSDKESGFYGFDHAAVGVGLMDYWNIDEQINDAVLTHHQVDSNSVGSLASVIDMADYLCAGADLGFYGELPHPSAETLDAYGCAGEAALRRTVQELRDDYDQESLLFKEL